MRFSMILEMVDRLSGPARRARAGARSLTDQARAMGQRIRQAAGDVRRGERSLTDIARSARRVAAAGLRQTFDRAGAGARRLIRNLRDLERRLRLAERAGFATGRALRGLGSAGLGMLKGGLFAGGAAAAGAGSFALFDLFRTAGQFEQYQTALEGTEGSVEAAQKSMAWVTKFAKDTPYEIAEVMESFVQLKAYGIDPANGSLTALGDAASGMSKPLMSAVEALADATTGEFERLKEFGIRASKEGNRVAFTFRKNGQDIRREADFTGAAVEEALVGIFNERFGGGMARQSKTFFGIISNLKGMWTEFLLKVANAGIFDFVKGKLQGLLDKVNAMAETGELDVWAKSISDKMEKAWIWAEKFIDSDWGKVVDDLRRLADAAQTVADTILAIKEAASWLNAGSSVDNFIGSVPERLKSFADPQLRVPEIGEVPIGAEVLRGRGVKLPNFNRQPSVDVGGTIKIDVTSSPDLKVRAQPVKSPGWSLPVETRTGRTMRSSS